MAQGQSDVKPKFEAEFKIRIETVEEFNRNMEIITNMSVPTKTIEVLYKKAKFEMDVRPKIETNFRAKSEPIDDINKNLLLLLHFRNTIDFNNSSLDIITSNMNVNVNCETQHENNEVPFTRPKVEMDVKSKIERDFKVKIEPIDVINRGMEIIGSMNIPFKTEIFL